MADAILRGAVRKKLTNNATINVTTAGVDATADGSVANPFRQISAAVNYICGNIDVGGNEVHIIIQCGSGTYAGNIYLGPYVGIDAGAKWNGTNTVPGIEIKGDTTTPGNCIIQTDSTVANPFAGAGDGTQGAAGILNMHSIWSVRGFSFTSTGGQPLTHLIAQDEGKLTFDRCAFATSNAGQAIYASTFSTLTDYAGGSWSCSGGGQALVWADSFGNMGVGGAVTFSGTPAFSLGVLVGRSSGGIIFYQPTSVTSTATGPRFSVLFGGALVVYSPNSVSGLPGNATGDLDNSSHVADVGGTGLVYNNNMTCTVAQLPAFLRNGARAAVSDASTTYPGNDGNTVTGGGANSAPVWKDSSGAWRYG